MEIFQVWLVVSNLAMGQGLYLSCWEEQPSIWVNDELYSNDLTATKPWNDSVGNYPKKKISEVSEIF